MTVGRTLEKYTRVYMDGFDVSGYGRTIGPLEVTYEEVDLTAQMSDAVRGFMRGRAHANIGIFNAVFDNTATTGLHAVLSTAGGERVVLVAKGQLAAPAEGDVVFGGAFVQKAYTPLDDGGALTVSIPFMGWSVVAATLAYANPWGVLLHKNEVRLSATGVNTSNNGVDNPEAGATTKGGYFAWQITAGNGTATVLAQDSADNSSDWQPLSGATSGELNCSNRQAGIVALATSATVRRYIRWQIAFNSATTVTWVAAFMRGF